MDMKAQHGLPTECYPNIGRISYLRVKMQLYSLDSGLEGAQAVAVG